MSATINYSYSLTFRVPPSKPGKPLPAKRAFRNDLSEPQISAGSKQQQELSSINNIPTPPKSNTMSQHHPWQWKLMLTEEERPTLLLRRGGGVEGSGRGTEVNLSVELREISIASTFPSSGPFSGSLLQYKSFSLVAKSTRFTLVSKSIDTSSVLSLQAKVKASHVLDLEGQYSFMIVLSTESLVHETAMAPWGLTFPGVFLGPYGCYPQSIETMFDDPVSADVEFIWENRVAAAFDKDKDASGNKDESGDDDDDRNGYEEEDSRQSGITLSRLYAHQVVLHQYQYFRRKLPPLATLSSSSLSSSLLPQGESSDLMHRKLLVRDFSRPLFRVVLRWMYTRTLDATRIVAAHNGQPSKCSGGAVQCSLKDKEENEKQRVTWQELHDIADNLELEELRVLARSKIGSGDL